VLCAVDARRGEIFVQSFNLDEGVVALDEPFVSVPQLVIDAWSKRSTPVTLTGDGVARYAVAFREVPADTFFEQLVPSPLEALRLGATRTAEDEVTPLYLREADAVANFSTRGRLP
jgi:tRNA A37 threonylcarbamoyladenosine modification protein TsaB